MGINPLGNQGVNSYYPRLNKVQTQEVKENTSVNNVGGIDVEPEFIDETDTQSSQAPKKPNTPPRGRSKWEKGLDSLCKFGVALWKTFDNQAWREFNQSCIDFWDDTK